MFSTLAEAHPSRYSCDGCGEQADVWTDLNEPMCQDCLDWERQAYRSGPAQEAATDGPADKCCEGLGRYHTSTCPRMSWLARREHRRAGPCGYPGCECATDQTCAELAEQDDAELAEQDDPELAEQGPGRNSKRLKPVRRLERLQDVMTDPADSPLDQLGREPLR